MTNWKHLAIVAILSIFVHGIFFGHPNQIVFDEVHFGKFISCYYTHEYYFDIHPPLGKLLIAGFAAPFGFKPEFAFSDIGDIFPDKQNLVLRFLPFLAGTLLPILFYLILKELGASSLASLSGGLFIVFENAFLTQSRFILLDPLLFTFGAASTLFYLRYFNHRHLKNAFWAGFFGALAMSIKWTGIAPLALAGLVEFIILIRQHSFRRFGLAISAFAILPLSFYFIIFSIHFALLTKSGPGDAFMTPEFLKTLDGTYAAVDPNIRSKNLIGKFIELNAEMYDSNRRLEADHPYASQWYQWPFMTRPIYYWVQDFARVYLIGNPILWWSSTLAVLTLILSLVFRTLKSNWQYLFLLGGYLLNLLPFIGIKRIMFLYHYMPAYLFAIAIMVLLIDQQDKRDLKFKMFLALIIAVFIYFAPFNYGLSLTPDGYESRMWFEGWK